MFVIVHHILELGPVRGVQLPQLVVGQVHGAGVHEIGVGDIVDSGHVDNLLSEASKRG